jgi:hypothetical protein
MKINFEVTSDFTSTFLKTNTIKPHLFACRFIKYKIKCNLIKNIKEFNNVNLFNFNINAK